MAGTVGETWFLQLALIVVCCVFGVVLLLGASLDVVLVKWMLVIVVIVLRCCLGFCGLHVVFWEAIYISTLVVIHSIAPVSFYGCTSSPWELPHRVVHLNKGEGKMVFQHRGYGSVSASADLLSKVFVLGTMWWMLCWMLCGCSAVWHLFGMTSSSMMKFCMMAIYYYGLINRNPPGVTVSRLPVQFFCILYV